LIQITRNSNSGTYGRLDSMAKKEQHSRKKQTISSPFLNIVPEARTVTAIDLSMPWPLCQLVHCIPSTLRIGIPNWRVQMRLYKEHVRGALLRPNREKLSIVYSRRLSHVSSTLSSTIIWLSMIRISTFPRPRVRMTSVAFFFLSSG